MCVLSSFLAWPALMAYVPPHMRTGKRPAPEMPAFQGRKSLNLGPNSDRSGKIRYADSAISKWFAVGLDPIPPSIVLQEVPVDKVERPLALVKNGGMNQDGLDEPWINIANRVLPDLINSFEKVKSIGEGHPSSSGRTKPVLFAKVGTILFHGSRNSSRQEEQGRTLLTESFLRRFKRTFYTNVPGSYMDHVMKDIVPKIEVEFEQMKDLYNVKLSDKSRPNVTISCKCRVLKEEQKIQLYKIEENPTRHMVADISCLGKNLDLRLMLTTKTILTSLGEDEIAGIGDLINSAVLDRAVKGGLRWPLRNASSRDRFQVIGVWHTTSRAYTCPRFRLKVRNADRFDFKSSSGEATGEVSLKLKGLASELLESELNQENFYEMLVNELKILWELFLHSDRFLM